jgi:NAD(P)-dependent dehydrogenase (short-subunit alcohol dehydrogenase family)
MIEPGNVLIPDADRGIGAEFVRQFLVAGWRVHGPAQNYAGLEAIEPAGAMPHRLDMTSEDSLELLTAEVAQIPLEIIQATFGISGHLTPRAFQTVSAFPL